MDAIEKSIKQNMNYKFVHLGDEWAKSIVLPSDCDINENIIQMFKAGIR